MPCGSNVPAAPALRSSRRLTVFRNLQIPPACIPFWTFWLLHQKIPLPVSRLPSHGLVCRCRCCCDDDVDDDDTTTTTIPATTAANTDDDEAPIRPPPLPRQLCAAPAETPVYPL